MRSAPRPSDLRAALWALRALRAARRQLPRARVTDLVLPHAPALPDRAIRAVNRVLRRSESTCLERSLVLQGWHAAHGRPTDVVIGVRGPGETFAAHAWLDGEAEPGEFEEITRLPAR